MTLSQLYAGLVFAVCAAPLGAQTTGSVGIEVDNDLFTTFDPAHATDHEYTHGTRVWIESDHLQIFPESFPSWLSCRAADTCRDRITLGQEIYTPRREAPQPIQGERPHAAWLHLSIETARTGERSSTGFGLQVGVIGPPALGEEVQKLIHGWFDFRVPEGWQHQLPFEPTLQLRMSRTGQLFTTSRGVVGAAAGYDLRADFGNALMRGMSSLEAKLCLGTLQCALVHNGETRSAAVIVQGSIGSALVLRNALLDGTLRESRSVRKTHWVPTAAVAIAARLGRIELRYGLTWRGREYLSEPGDFSYGTLRIQYSW